MLEGISDDDEDEDDDDDEELLAEFAPASCCTSRGSPAS